MTSGSRAYFRIYYPLKELSHNVVFTFSPKNGPAQIPCTDKIEKIAPNIRLTTLSNFQFSRPHLQFPHRAYILALLNFGLVAASRRKLEPPIVTASRSILAFVGARGYPFPSTTIRPEPPPWIRREAPREAPQYLESA